MANKDDIATIIYQFEQKSHSIALGVSREPDEAAQADLYDIATFVNSICDDFQNSTQVMELKITQQPQPSFSFRFKSQTIASNRHLSGRNKAGRGCKNYPSVELRQCSHIAHAAESDDYFIRCTLHQPLAAGETTSFLSPHLLCRRNAVAAVYAEMEMLPCIKVAPLVYSFTLENFTILKTARKDWLGVLIHKMQKRQEKNFSLTGSNGLREHQSRAEFERIANEQVKRPQHKVRICFEAFQRTPYGYVQVTKPAYTECISNGEPPQIELCNKSAAMNELTMMTIKVNTVRPKDTILIFHDKDDDHDDDVDGADAGYESSDWQKCITVEEQMIHERSAVTFQMPIYRDNKLNTGQDIIKCGIQLERLSDGAHSNKGIFYYINTMKRQRNQFGEIIELQQNGRNFKTTSSLLQEKLFSFYEKSKAMDCEQKSKLIKDVREYYISYQLAHSEGNSLLHDILLDADATVHDMDIYTIIEHFQLQDLVSQSINIYGETVLMFACMFERTHLMETLIDMGSSISAQDTEFGNNVLHIAMQQKTAECRNSLIQALKTNRNSASFIKALGSYNLRGMTPLHLAVLQNYVPIVDELLQFCKRQNAFEICQLGQQSDGNTILHLAVLNRFIAMRACILKHFGDSFKNVINYADRTVEEL